MDSLHRANRHQGLEKTYTINVFNFKPERRNIAWYKDITVATVNNLDTNAGG